MPKERYNITFVSVLFLLKNSKTFISITARQLCCDAGCSEMLLSLIFKIFFNVISVPNL